MTHTAYIVRISLADADIDGPTPDAWYKPKVNGEFIPAGHTPTGRPRWFTSVDAAVAAVHEALWGGDPGQTCIVWEPQYDSSWAEALDEPCGYVARIS